MNKTIPYGHQSIHKEDIEALLRVLRTDFITQGPTIKAFEKSLCGYTGARYAVAVSSGTAALHLACMAAGIRVGDEVITSPLTFVASVNCVLYCAGKPVFADIEKDTGNIAAAAIKKIITKKTKAIIPVHLAGHPCDLEALRVIAQRNNLLIIEDAAHALGAKYQGQKIGSCKYSDMAIFSFHPVKAITTGEGGAIVTNNKRYYENLMLLRNHGITRDTHAWERKRMKGCGWYYEMLRLGFNYRLTDIQAALGISQLKKLTAFIYKRRKLAARYDEYFRNNPYFNIPTEKPYAYSAYHLYPIRLKEVFKSKRKTVFEYLRKKGIGVQVHYIPVYMQPYYRRLGFREGVCPGAEDYYERTISLPIYPDLKESQIKYIADHMFRICARQVSSI